MDEFYSDLKQSAKKSLWIRRLLSSYLVLKTAVGVTFFMLAFGFFTFVFRISDLGRIIILVFGLFVILLCIMLKMEYIMKTIHLQRNNEVKNYSSILAVNTLFGLVLPLFYENLILAVIMRAMRFMTYYGTFWCKMRVSIVNFYYNTEIYTQVNTIIFWIIIFGLALFIFGGLLEKLNRKNN